ncbi:MAG: YdcF family protein [Pseudomonadota bacterium]
MTYKANHDAMQTDAHNTSQAGTKNARPHATQHSAKRVSLRLAVTALCGAVLVGTALAFADFVRDVGTLSPPDDTSASGLVVLTGGADRIEVALRLLQDGPAERLLISGVHGGTDASALIRRTHVDPDLFACCVDLGYTARDTAGNAQEAADWAREHAFSSLLVVTSAYHVPRTTFEMSNYLPDVEIQAYPVDPATENSSTGTWPLRLMAREFVKLHVARLRHLFGGSA